MRQQHKRTTGFPKQIHQKGNETVNINTKSHPRMGHKTDEHEMQNLENENNKTTETDEEGQ